MRIMETSNGFKTGFGNVAGASSPSFQGTAAARCHSHNILKLPLVNNRSGAGTDLGRAPFHETKRTK
jgi:hypothetical protein